MGTNRTPNEVRGFIVPWQMDKSNYWADESSITQGTQRVGIPDPTNPTSLALGTKGLQTEDVQVFTLEAGHVGEGAKYGWKYSADSLIYGCQQPNVLTNVTAIAKLNLTGQKYIVRDSITLLDGTILVTVEYTTVTNNNIRVYQIDPNGTVSMHSINTVTISSLGNNFRFPCLVQLANGNVLLMFWAYDDPNTTVLSYSRANITVYQTVDNGNTWDLVSKRALNQPIEQRTASNTDGVFTSLGRISAAATESQILLMCEVVGYYSASFATQNIGIQYASISQGMKFDFIAQSDYQNEIEHAIYLANIVQFNGVFVLTWIHNRTQIYSLQISNAYTDIFAQISNVNIIESGDLAVFVNLELTNGQKCMHVDVDGRIYLYAYDLASEVLAVAYSDTQGLPSVEYGKTWFFMGYDPTIQTPQLQDGYCLSNDLTVVKNITTTHHNGSQKMFCNWNPNGTNSYKDSLIQLTFGCWATQTNPPSVLYAMDHQWTHNTGDWVPSDLPNNSNIWTLATILTPTLTLTGDRLSTVCTNGEQYVYTKTMTNTTRGASMHVVFDNVEDGTPTAGPFIEIKIRDNPNTGNAYHVRLIVNGTALYLYDVFNGLMDSVTGLQFDQLAIMMYLDNKTGDVTVWYGDSNKPRQYLQLNGRAVKAVDSIQFGEFKWGAYASTGSRINWAYVSYLFFRTIGIGYQNVPAGKQYPALGYYAPLTDGMYITTADGPARETDQWDITPQYDTPIERVLYPLYPSRGIEWRSDAVANPDTTNVPIANIAWAIDPNDLGQTITPRNSVVGIHLNGINFRQMQMYIHNGTTWVLHSSVQNQVGSEFDFSRNGNTITVTSANTDRPFLHYNECAGWYLELEDEDENRYMRKIRINSEGILDFNAITQGVIFTLEDAKPTDPTVGVARIVPDACTVLLHNVISTSGIKIVLPAQKTQQGYFKIGHMVMGPVVIPATQYGRGRTISWEASTDVTTAPNGVQYANVRGRGGRTVRIGWVDGVDISELYQYTPNPDYYTTRPGGSPEATIGSAPTTMYGIVQQIQGEKNAIVYLPVIDTTSSANYDVINRYHDHVMVTLGNDVQIENVIGDESKNEVLRVGTVVMREVR